MEIRKNIVLVDDHVIIRNGLKELIEKLGPYHVTKQFDNGRKFIDALPLSPEADLVIMDISMPELHGDEVIEQMKNEGCKIPFLVLTLNENENLIVKLFRSGARGYLKKNCSAKELKEALTDIFRTGYYHNEFLTLSLHTSDNHVKKSNQQLIIEQLSDREREFLKLVCHEKEYTYEQIADQMKVQHRTVDGYRESIFEKFSIKSKTGLVLFILKHKLFEYL